MHLNSRLLFDRHAKPYFKGGMKVLEIGPNRIPSSYCESVGNSELTWDTLDIYSSEELTYANSKEHKFAVTADSYDIVLSGQVIEHVRKIWVWIKEVERVCKPGGVVIIISPVSWPYHEAPIDCWRIYPEGMKALLEETSLEVLHCKFESLEGSPQRRYIPGKSMEWVNPLLRKYYKLVEVFGVPVERAYDLITIARKPTLI